MARKTDNLEANCSYRKLVDKIHYNRYVTCSKCGETAGMLSAEKNGWILDDTKTLEIANKHNVLDQLPTRIAGFGHKNRCDGRYESVTPITEEICRV